MNNLIISLLFFPLGVMAITTQTLDVGATITPGCIIGEANNGGVLGSLNFGNWPGTATATPVASLVAGQSITLTCTPGTTLQISIDGGQHYTNSRNLAVENNNTLIAYHLYNSNEMTAGSEIAVNSPFSLNITSDEGVVLPVYARAQLEVLTPAGIYTDTLNITLSW